MDTAPPGSGPPGPDLPAPPPPPTDRPAVPWGIGEAFGVLVMVFVLVMVTAGALGALVRADALGQAVAEALILPLSLVLLGVPTVAYVALRHRAAPALTGERYARIRDVAVGLGGGFLAWIVINQGLGLVIQVLLGDQAPNLQPQFRQALCDSTAMPFFVIGAVVLAPLAEEVFFRGMLFQAVRQRAGVGVGAVVSALVFAFLHAGEVSLAAGITLALVFPLGVFLAVLFHRRRTIVAPMSAHVMFNILSVLALALTSTSC